MQNDYIEGLNLLRLLNLNLALSKIDTFEKKFLEYKNQYNKNEEIDIAQLFFITREAYVDTFNYIGLKSSIRKEMYQRFMISEFPSDVKEKVSESEGQLDDIALLFYLRKN